MRERKRKRKRERKRESEREREKEKERKRGVSHKGAEIERQARTGRDGTLTDRWVERQGEERKITYILL